MILFLILIGFVLGSAVAAFALGGGLLAPIAALVFFALAALGPIALAAAFAPHRRHLRVPVAPPARLEARLSRQRRETA